MQKDFYNIESKVNEIKIKALIEKNEIKEAWELDNFIFHSHKTVKFNIFKIIAASGGLFGTKVNGKLIGISSILVNPITGYPPFDKDTALCFGTAVLPEFRRKGYGSALAACQELLAKKYRKYKLMLTVRPENASNILMRMKLGYKIIRYDPYYFGNSNINDGRLIMGKDTIEIPNENILDEITYSVQVSCLIGNETDISARQRLEKLQSDGLLIVNYKIYESGLFGTYQLK